MTYQKNCIPWNKGKKLKQTTTIINCLYCGKQKEVKNSEIKRGNGKYCSPQCAGKHTAKRKSIEEYKSKSRKKEAIIRYYKENKEYKCNVKNCNFNLTLDLHRIRAGKEYSIKNTILLCPNHHALITRKLKKLKEILK